MCVDLSLGFIFCSIDLYFCLCLAPYFEFSLYHAFFFFLLFPPSHVVPFVNLVTFYLLYFSSYDLEVTDSISILLAFLSMRQKNICEPVSSFFFG